jgi:hypothetical protein
MKTIFNWLIENLNDNDANKVSFYLKKNWTTTRCDTFQEALRLAFDWTHSTEGVKYWSIIARNGGSLGVSKKVEEYLEEIMGNTITNDPIVQSVMNDLNERSKVGVKKYGTTLDREDLTPSEWANHLYEELLDASLYIKKLTNKLKQYETKKS